MLKISKSLIEASRYKESPAVVMAAMSSLEPGAEIPIHALFHLPGLYIDDVLWAMQCVAPEDADEVLGIYREFACDLADRAIRHASELGARPSGRLRSVVRVSRAFALSEVLVGSLNAARKVMSSVSLSRINPRRQALLKTPWYLAFETTRPEVGDFAWTATLSEMRDAATAYAGATAGRQGWHNAAMTERQLHSVFLYQLLGGT